MWRTVVGLAMAGLVVWAGGWQAALAQTEAPPAHDELAPAHEEPSPAAELGWGMAAVGTNLLYIPAKLIYAMGGGLIGLLAWGVTLGDNDVALGILQPTLGGTWVVTPEMLRGEQPIMFPGPSYEPKRSS